MTTKEGKGGGREGLEKTDWRRRRRRRRRKRMMMRRRRGEEMMEMAVATARARNYYGMPLCITAVTMVVKFLKRGVGPESASPHSLVHRG